MADGLGNVYVNGRGDWTVKKYDLDGNPIQTFQLGSVSQLGQDGPTAIDLAPDECTLYYGVSEGMYGAIGRFNVCASVQEASFAGPYAPTDGLRVLPNWQVVSQGDPGARLLDTSGQSIRKYSPPPGQGASPSNSFRTIGLAADGRSVWMCCGHTASHGLYHAWRFDINGGAPLSVWPALSAVYGPPLLGDANVESTVDSTPAGTAEAFCTQVGYSGPMTRLHLWVDSSSTAHQLVVGIYSDRIERPSILLEHATITNVRPGSWNYADIRSMAVSDGQRYWIAVLAPSGDGAARFRVTARGKRSQTSARHNLTGLPGRWSGPAENPASLSGYGS